MKLLKYVDGQTTNYRFKLKNIGINSNEINLKTHSEITLKSLCFENVYLLTIIIGIQGNFFPCHNKIIILRYSFYCTQLHKKTFSRATVYRTLLLISDV